MIKSKALRAIVACVVFGILLGCERREVGNQELYEVISVVRAHLKESNGDSLPTLEVLMEQLEGKAKVAITRNGKSRMYYLLDNQQVQELFPGLIAVDARDSKVLFAYSDGRIREADESVRTLLSQLEKHPK